MVNMALTGLLILCMALIAVIRAKKIETSNDFFNQDYTTALKGIICIVIILVHIPMAYQNKLQDMVGSFGYVCVTIFFMCSAYGLKYGANHKKGYLDNFWRNRLAALLIPCILINLCKAVFQLIFDSKLADVMSALYSIDGFVRVLLIFYVAYYFLYKYEKKLIRGYIDIILCLIILAISIITKYTSLAIVGRWPTECIGLIWGVLLYNYFEHIKLLVQKKNTQNTIILCVASLILGVAYLKFKPVIFFGDYLLKIALAVTIIMFIISLTVCMKIGNPISMFLGKISYEVYLAHRFVMSSLVCICPWISSGVFIILTVLFTVIFASIVHAFDKKLILFIRK
jgi:peptidoglycan/LPS O-acetylase OafA/YrhL